jgi:hypothetical protein
MPQPHLTKKKIIHMTGLDAFEMQHAASSAIVNGASYILKHKQ